MAAAGDHGAETRQDAVSIPFGTIGAYGGVAPRASGPRNLPHGRSEALPELRRPPTARATPGRRPRIAIAMRDADPRRQNPERQVSGAPTMPEKSLRGADPCPDLESSPMTVLAER